MVDHDVRGSARHVGGVRRNQHTINVVIDFPGSPDKLVMMKAGSRRGEEYAAVLLLRRTDPIRHPHCVRVLALDFKVDLGLRIVDEAESGRDLTGDD